MFRIYAIPEGFVGVSICLPLTFSPLFESEGECWDWCMSQEFGN